jgi:(E)-4-hydroxy-3-methylbut-2-enyl-diphosphate synthase
VRLVEAGCEIVRITAPTASDAKAIGEVKRRLRGIGVQTPLVADIHFSPAAAMEAAEHVEKVRVNPGNFADQKFFRVREYSDEDYAAEIDRTKSVAPLVPGKNRASRCASAPITAPVRPHHEPLRDTPAGMVESALEFVRIARSTTTTPSCCR